MSKPRKSAAHVSPIIAVRECEFRFTPSQRLVLYALASRLQSFDHDVWPSMATLAANTGLSDRQVRRVVHELVDLGVLVEQNTDRRTKTYRMVLPHPDMVSSQPDTLSDGHGVRGPCHGVRVGGHGVRSTPDMVSSEEKGEVQRKEESEETTNRDAVARVGAPLTTAELDMLRTIVTTPELARYPAPYELAKSIVAIGGDVDVLQRIVGRLRSGEIPLDGIVSAIKATIASNDSQLALERIDAPGRVLGQRGAKDAL